MNIIFLFIVIGLGFVFTLGTSSCGGPSNSDTTTPSAPAKKTYKLNKKPSMLRV